MLLRSIQSTAVLLIVACVAKAAPVAEDISILFPLPATYKESRALWSLEEVAAYGPLFPQTLYGLMPYLARTLTEEELISDTRIVSVRLDPCFKEQLNSSCKAQVRMVAQPVYNYIESASAEDAAFHLFYELPQQELVSLIVKMMDLRKKYQISDTNVLGVHRGLKLGLNSDYAKEFKAIIFNSVGESRLSRITFMLMRGRRNVWHFGGIQRTGQHWEAINIPNTNEQRKLTDDNGSILNFLVQSIGRVFELRASVSPIPVRGDNASYFFQPLLANRPQEELAVQSVVLNRIENPHLNTADSVDCVSCHVADTTRRYFSNILQNSNWFSQQDIFKNTKVVLDPEIDNATPIQFTTNLRAFGYFNETPVITRRTLNETAAILETIVSSY